MSGTNIDRVNHGGSVTVAIKGSEALVRDDQEFANRLAERTRGLFARLTATGADRRVAAHRSKMIGQAADARAENYRMHLEVQRQAI